MRTRRDKLTLVTSVIAFFAAIGVVGWFGLTGIEMGEDDEDSGAMIVFAGGSPAQVADEGDSEPLAETGAADDGYVVGSFGDPVTELYADEDDGGWGELALDRASERGAGAS